MSKTYLLIFNHLIGIGLFLVISSCAVSPRTPISSPSLEQEASQQESGTSPASTSMGKNGSQSQFRQDGNPRAVASLSLTEQARTLIDGGKPDDAIRTLERAVNLNPSNGQNYFYLAEAWLRKGYPNQAREFNRLAAMYLRGEPDWMNRVKGQEERIRKRL